MIEIFKEKSLDKSSLPEEIAGIISPQAFVALEDGEVKGRVYFSEQGETYRIEGVFFPGEKERAAFLDSLLRGLLNAAEFRGKEKVLCGREELFPELLLAGFARGEDGIVFARPGEFFSRKCSGGCKKA